MFWSRCVCSDNSETRKVFQKRAREEPSSHYVLPPVSLQVCLLFRSPTWRETWGKGNEIWLRDDGGTVVHKFEKCNEINSIFRKRLMGEICLMRLDYIIWDHLMWLLQWNPLCTFTCFCFLKCCMTNVAHCGTKPAWVCVTVTVYTKLFVKFFYSRLKFCIFLLSYSQN